jgi:HPt (histidine-containing phosphotransfer) domain-containing protein
MTDTLLDRSALADLQETAGPEFANVLFTQIRADFARLHDEVLRQTRGYAPSAEPDFEATRRVVHEMKGLSLTVGAATLAQTCADAEILAQGRDLGALKGVLPDIIAQCGRVRIELEQCIAGVE